MNTTKKIFLAVTAALALAVTHADAATTDAFGYCTDAVARGNIFRMGSSTAQGMAIRLSAEKCAMLQGAKITGVRTAFGSKRTADGNVRVFVSTSPGQPAITENNAAVPSTVKWVDLSLSTPYTITGQEEGLFIGYTAEIDANVSMLMADKEMPVADGSYVFYDGDWHSTETLTCGNVSLRAIVQDAPAVTDLLLKPVEANGYFKAGETYTLSAQVLNFGNQPVNSLTYSLQLGDGPAQTQTLEIPALAPCAVYTFNLPQMRAETEGAVDLTVNIGQVNQNVDSEPVDNRLDSRVVFYPSAMERSLLLEGFTGQACSNCPSGHSTINEFLGSVSEGSIIEMMHHSGYQPDFMTTTADADFTLFYGPNATYAPAFMMNRTVFPQIGSVPVNFVTQTNLTDAYTTLQKTHPYFSLAVESTYDPASRKLCVKLRTLAHVVPEAENVVVNIALVQDGIIHMQTPYGANYAHNRVHRTMLTGNSWGVALPAEALAEGAEWEWTTEYTLPEAIFSDYYNPASVTENMMSLYNIATDPANMSLIAYVAEFTQGDVAANRIFNAVETPLGSTHVQGGMAGIPTVGAEGLGLPEIKVVDSRVVVEGECRGLEVYTADGSNVDPASTLQPGVYVVRAPYHGGVAVKKISIR